MNSDKEKTYDLIVVGGGTSGAAAAISAARCGIKTLLIEKNSYLGGAMTSQLVMPMMNNISFRNEVSETKIINHQFWRRYYQHYTHQEMVLFTKTEIPVGLILKK